MKRLYAIGAGLIVSSIRRAGRLSGIHKLCILSAVLIALPLSFCENIMEQVKNYNEVMEIISVSPADNAVNVAINTDISARFTNDADMSTVDASTFYLNGGAVTGTFSYNPAIKAVIFTPASDLLHNTLYTVNITQGLRNLAGNYITAPYAWSFTTLQYYFNVLSVYPLNGEIDVPVNTDVIVQFDDNINISSVDTTTFIVDGGAGAVAGVYSIDALLRTVTFNPSASLNATTLYTVTLTTGIKNIKREAMASNYSWSFTTGILLLPEIYITSPLGTDMLSGDSFDFGNQVNPGSWIKTFTIGNSGTGTLTIGAVNLSDMVNYSTSLVSGTITAGNSSTFTVTFHPDAVAGIKNATLTISSDDADEGSFVINLTGLGLSAPAPEIQITDNGIVLVSPTSTVDFGTITVGGTGTQTIVIHNIGTADLNITSTTIGGTDPAYYSTGFTTATIPSGGTANVVISFSAPIKINTRATITFQNNDSDEASFVVKLKGRTMP